MKIAVVLAGLVFVSAVTLRAQELAPPAPLAEEDDADVLDSRPHIQVLEHPYDISSFYRSSQSEAQGYQGYESDEPAAGRYAGRYPIASFYRAGGGNGAYSRFWTTGYGGDGSSTYGGDPNSGRRGVGRGRGLIGSARPRALGLNGDLCLFAPTFLAPVGPLTGVFFEK